MALEMALLIKFLSHDDSDQTIIATDANRRSLLLKQSGEDWESATGLIDIEHSLFEESFGIHIVEEATQTQWCCMQVIFNQRLRARSLSIRRN